MRREAGDGRSRGGGATEGTEGEGVSGGKLGGFILFLGVLGGKDFFGLVVQGVAMGEHCWASQAVAHGDGEDDGEGEGRDEVGVGAQW